MNKMAIVVWLGIGLPLAMAERDPFHKGEVLIASEPQEVLVGVIGDGRCWRIWHTLPNTRWRESLPLFSPRCLLEKTIFRLGRGTLEMSPHVRSPVHYPFECDFRPVLEEGRN